MDLSDRGIHFNEINNISILHPDIYKKAVELSKECEIYEQKLDQIETLTNQATELVQKFGDEIIAEEMKAIGVRNLLHGMEKQRKNNENEIDEIFDDLLVEIERLKVQINSLKKTEIQQNDVIAQLTRYD